MGWWDDLKAGLASDTTPIDPATAAAQERRKGGYIDPSKPADPATGLPPSPGPAPVAPPPATEPFPGVAAQTESGEDNADGVDASMDMRDAIYPHDIMPVGPMGPVGVARPAYEDKYAVGGAKGADEWTNAWEKPGEIESAITAGAEAEGQLGEAKADYWKRTQKSQDQELAALQGRRLENQQQIAQQQQHIQQATERYSNDLADRGQFWKNPAHIIGAIGASLMALGSGGPAIGQKLINDAVNADFQQRKQLADMHLGELRSNLHSYRQIAGDKEAGDKMALSESYRVAAMELERIGAQFQGPIAKAKAAEHAKQMLLQADLLRMNMFNHTLYNKAAVVDPRLAAAQAASPGYTPYGGKAPSADKAPTSTSSPHSGGHMGSEASAPTAAAVQSGNPAAIEHVLKKLVKPLSPEVTARFEARSPGSSRQVERVRMANAKRAWYEAGGKPQEFHNKLAALEKEQEGEIKLIGTAAAPFIGRVGGMRRLGRDIDVMEKVAERLHTDPDTLMGEGSRNILGGSFMAKYKDVMHSLSDTDPKNANKYKRELQETENAVESFKQALAGHQNVYIHDKSGGAVNASEMLRMTEFLRKGWRGTKTYHGLESRSANDELNNAINSTGSPASGMMWKAMNGINSTELDRPGIPATGKTNVQKAISNVRGK